MFKKIKISSVNKDINISSGYTVPSNKVFIITDIHYKSSNKNYPDNDGSFTFHLMNNEFIGKKIKPYTISGGTGGYDPNIPIALQNIKGMFFTEGETIFIRIYTSSSSVTYDIILLGEEIDTNI